jgi:hypothetical protein
LKEREEREKERRRSNEGQTQRREVIGGEMSREMNVHERTDTTEASRHQMHEIAPKTRGIGMKEDKERLG